MDSEDRLLDIMHDAHALGIHNLVLDKVAELSLTTVIYDTHGRSVLFEKAFKLVINEHKLETEIKSII